MKTPFHIYVLCALLAIPIFSPCQKINNDSLYTVLKSEKEDTNKVNTLNVLSHQLYLTGHYDTAMVIAKQASELATHLDFKKGLGIAYFNIGTIKYFQSNLTEALKYDSEALAIETNIGFKAGMGDCYNSIGAIYYLKGKYDDALKNYQLAKQYAEQAGNKRTTASASSNMGNVELTEGHYPEALHNYLQACTIDEEIGFKRGLGDVCGNIGLVYYSEGNYQQAISYISKSLKIEEEIGNKISAGNAYHNLGDIYYIQNKYDTALENFRQALRIATEINNKEGMGYAHNNIGAIDFLQKKYDEALKNSLEGLEISRTIGNKYNIANAYINLGSINTMLKQNAKAGKYLDSAMALATALKDKDLIKDGYNAMTLYDSATGNYKKALDDTRKYILYRDSLKNEENTRKIVTEQMNYEFDKKQVAEKEEQDKKDLISTEKLKRQTLITWLAIGGSLLILAFIGLLFNRARLKQKTVYQQQLNERQKEQAVAVMETQEQERKRIAEDLHDSLGYLLSTVKLNLQASSGDPKKTADESIKLINQASTEIRNITFNLMPRTLEEEGLVPALRELVARTANAGAAKINLDLHDVEGMTLAKQTQFTIYRIIQEAVNNVFKYADAKEINIQLIKQEGQLTIMLEDDGKGFNVEQVKKGRGLKNMMSRSEWLNGTLNIDSGQGHGTTIILEIPV